MLLGEQRGRAQDAPGSRRRPRRRGAQRHLGLAEADVAAHQAVHRLACDHVGDTASIAAAWSGVSSKPKPSANASRSCCLIENESQPGSALGVQREQLGGGVAHLSRRAPWPCPTGRCPACAAAPPRAARRCSGRSRRAARPARRACRRLRTPAAGIRFSRPDVFLQALVAANAMLLVHHRLADLDLGGSRSMPSTEVRFSAPRPRRRTTPA